MDESKFKEIEEKYRELKEQLDRGEITSDDMKKTLKEMMVLDEDGRYWMIGGKTGKWYHYDGIDWREENPYGDDPSETKLFTKEEEEPVKDDTLRVEKIEKVEEEEKREEPLIEKVAEEPVLEKEIKIPEAKESKEKFTPKEISLEPKRVPQVQVRESELLIKSVKITSFIFFLGGLGLGLGVIFGAVFGIFPIFGDLIYQFGPMLSETHGKIQGGLIFAAIGGIGGFVVFSVIALIMGSLYNAISSLFGGVRFKIKS